MSVRVFAPAKINLTLEVSWPYRATGRHPLQSVVVFADVGDWIEAAPGAGLSLEIDGPFGAALAAEADNLVLRAARALAEAGGGESSGASLRLTKNLPIASGIGGGSSDAAATLKALNALWGLGLSEQLLTELAVALGGDAPVCVPARSAYMTGEGEVLEPLSLPPLPAVLVNPGTPVPTGAAFERFDAMAGGGGFTAKPAPLWTSFQEVCAGVSARGNMLMPAARALAPVIETMEAALKSDPASRCVSLSGSGATMFALTETIEDAQAIARRVGQQFPDWWVTPTTLALDARSGAR